MALADGYRWRSGGVVAGWYLFANRVDCNGRTVYRRLYPPITQLQKVG